MARRVNHGGIVVAEGFPFRADLARETLACNVTPEAISRTKGREIPAERERSWGLVPPEAIETAESLSPLGKTATGVAADFGKHPVDLVEVRIRSRLDEVLVADA